MAKSSPDRTVQKKQPPDLLVHARKLLDEADRFAATKAGTNRRPSGGFRVTLEGCSGRPSAPALRLLAPHALAAVTNIARLAREIRPPPSRTPAEMHRRARLCANTAIASPKARGRPAGRRTSSTVDVLAPRHPFNVTVVTVGPLRRTTPRPSGWQKRYRTKRRSPTTNSQCCWT
jgi:hypothetical protein